MITCYCNSGEAFNQCCEPIIKDISKAKTAEQLMRSRYSAYAVADINHLMISHYKSTRPVKDRKSILDWTQSVSWIGLQIIKTEAGTASDSEGWVEFKAIFNDSGEIQTIHENSYFVKENDIWYYKSGKHN